MENPDYDRAKESALRILKESYISNPPVPVHELVEVHGLALIKKSFDDDSFSGIINLEKKHMIINEKDSHYRQRFTIAHELGHWILHQKELYENKDEAILFRKPIGSLETSKIEKEANFFAANLLVPNFMLAEMELEFKNKSEKEKNRILSEIFEVSMEVIGYRLKYL